MPPKPARAPVLIAGGGPVGLYTSVLLSRFGVPSILLERQRAGIPHPRAHLINTRSMELFREVGLDQRVESLAPPMREWREFRYCRSLLGRQIACDDHMATPAWDVLQEASPARLTHVSQPGLEEVLREEAARLAPEAGSQLLFGYECAHFDVLPGGGVRVEARRATRGGGGEGGGEGEVIEMEGSALLACDGAHSPVRRALGLRLSGPPPLQHFKSVHFRAPSLAERLAERPAMLYFVFHPEAVAVLVAHHMGRGEWVAQLPFFPPLQDGTALDVAECGRIIEELVGGPLPDLSVCSAGAWRMSAKVAQRMSVGPVHLLGDAAHQFPPAGAFGMNTGLQDAHNIAWKLAAVHHGSASERLLSSYDAERRPVAHANARLAVHNYERGLRVAEALGLPAAAPDLAAGALGAASRAAPAPVARAFGSRRVAQTASAALDLARSGLLSSFGDRESGAARATPLADRLNAAGAAAGVGDARVAAAAAVVSERRALPLLFPRHELGFAYPARDAPRRQALGLDETEAEVEDETLRLCGAPGTRLPHHWLHAVPRGKEGGPEERPKADPAEPVSSLDLLHAASGGGEILPPESVSPAAFTLFVDAEDAGYWGGGAAMLLRSSGGSERDAPPPMLRVVAVATSAVEELSAAAAPGALLVQDPGGWRSKLAASPACAVLVRPDGHVAWRGESAEEGVASAQDAADRLEQVMRAELRR